MSKDIDPRIERTPEHPGGRWPSNFVLSHHPDDNGECHPDCPVRLLDEQAGDLGQASNPKGSTSWSKGKGTTGHEGWQRDAHANYEPTNSEGYGDSGPASRMFHQATYEYERLEQTLQPCYFCGKVEARGNALFKCGHTLCADCMLENGINRHDLECTWAYEVAEQLADAEPVRYEPKVSSAEREAGLDELETRTRHRVNAGGLENEPRFAPTQVKNNHPCLKPISLTKYLATLLLPPAAYAPRRILVPFSGVASEMAGCVLAGWESVTGIESNAAYVAIGEARMKWWSQWPGWGQTDVDAILAAVKVDDVGQMSLFDEAT